MSRNKLKTKLLRLKQKLKIFLILLIKLLTKRNNRLHVYK